MAQSQVEFGKGAITDARLLVFGPDKVKESMPLTDKIFSFSLSQDLFRESIHIVLTIQDDIGFITRFNKFGLQGQEYLLLKYQNSDGISSFDLQFWIYDVGDIEFSKRGDGMKVNLSGFTKEKVIDTYTSVNQAYDDTYSNVANSVFDSYITKSSITRNFFTRANGFKTRKLFIHDSLVQNDFIIPGKQPFEAIEMCSRRAMGRKGGNTASSAFIFYEDISGYHFKNLEDIISEGKKSDKIRKYEYTPMAEKSSGKNVNNQIQKLFQGKIGNNLHNGNGGILKNKVLVVDPVKKTFFNNVYDYSTNFSVFKHLGDSQLIDNDFINNFTKPSYEHLYLKDSTKKNQRFDTVIGNRTPFIIQLHNMSISFEIYGDVSIVPGEVVYLEIAEFSGITDNRSSKMSTKLSGYWLINEVMHIHTSESLLTTVTCMKDSITKAIGE